MIMNLSIVSGIFLFTMISQGAIVEDRTYSFKTTSESFSCGSGTENSDETLFPLRGTVISFLTSRENFVNTKEVSFFDYQKRPCSDFSNLLQVSGEFEGKASQTFSESLKRLGEKNECFNVIREQLTIKVQDFTLTGTSSTYLPMSDSDCH